MCIFYRRVAIVLIGVAALASTSCRQSSMTEEADGKDSSRLEVIASNYPLEYFVERVAGDLANVQCLAPVGVDPALWKPTEADVRKLQQAKLVVLNGAGYEQWLTFTTLRENQLLDTSASFTDRLILTDEQVVHQHGPEGEHSHSKQAFTVWLDPHLASTQAQAVRDAVARLLPGHRETFEANYVLLDADLLALEKELVDLGVQAGDRPVLGSHPVYQYLARCAGLNMKSVHFEPHELPSDAQWQALDDLLKSHPAKLMFWEGQPLPETAEKLQDRGIVSIVFDVCGNRPSQGDYMQVMRENVRRAAAALSEAK